MRTRTITVSDDYVPTINLGRQGENAVSQVIFDVSSLITDYGAGEAAIVVSRPGEDRTYTYEEVQQSGNYVVWLISNVDTEIAGNGQVQLFWMVGGAVAKSITYQTYTEPALMNPTDMPVSEGGWLTEQLGDLNDLQTTDKSNLVAAINEVNEDVSDLKQELQDIIDHGVSSVPTEVRMAINTLLANALYENDDLADEKSTVEAWATEVTSITLDKTSITISGTGTNQITAVTVPYGSPVIWSTSNPTVATISNTGLVTGVGNGSCVITATAGEKSATCSVAVSDFAMYDITNVLTNCTNSNIATSIAEGDSYSGTLTIPIDHSFDSVVITMGGVDITSSVYSNRVINIPQVTGDVVITAIASLNYVLYDWARGKAQGSDHVINTGIIFDPALSAYDVTFSYMMETDQTSTQGTSVLGCRSASTPTGANNAFNIIMDTSTFAYHVLGVDSTPHISYTKNVLHEVEWHYNDTNPSGFVFDDVEYTVATLAKSSIVQSTKSFCLLGTNKNGTIENGPLSPYIKLGEVKISNPETGTLLYDFVPAVSKVNGDNGFYDMVNHVFFGKSSTYVECGNWT